MTLFVDGGRVVATVMPVVTRQPQSEAQQRLGWWLAGRERSDRPLWRLIGEQPGTTERLLRGELEPGDEMAGRIEEATGGAVRVADWDRPAPGTWSDRPPERVLQ